MITNSSHLERWLGREQVESISYNMRDWYGPPIPLANVPGRIYAMKGGDFCGKIRGGRFANMLDYTMTRINRAVRRFGLSQRSTLNTGFASLSDLISEATAGGKMQNLPFYKVGTTGVVAFSNSLWRVGSMPVSAGAATALAGGDVLDNTSTGGLNQVNPSGSDTLHLTTITAAPSTGTNFLLLYDRLWQGLIALSSSATQTCTFAGYPNSTGRYSSATASPGNFVYIGNEAGATLSAVAHNWTLVYTDNAGNTGQTATALAGISGAITNRVDHAGWNIPLLAGDTGMQDVESIACSVATLAAGAPTIAFCHPLAFIPQAITNFPVVLDGINSAFNLVEIKTNACLAFMELVKGATTATTYSGNVTCVSG